MTAPFDNAAWAYDAFMKLWRLYKDAAVVRALDLCPDHRVADLGGGTGHYAAVICRLCREVVVVDESERMLERVPTRSNVRALKADMAATGLPDAGFDAVLITDTLHHAPDQAALIREARRLLKPGGRVVILDFDAGCTRTRIVKAFEQPFFGPVNYLTPKQLEDLLSASGFADARMEAEGWCYVMVARRLEISEARAE